MIKIRQNVFETNSSSTHSIAIPKECDTSRLSHIVFGFGKFGWEKDEVDPINYLYTGIMDAYEEQADEYIEKLKKILDKHNITYHFKEPKYTAMKYGKYFDSGYVDHAYKLRPLIEDLLNDEDKLLRYLAGARVFTGNDNGDMDGYIHRNEPTYFEGYWNEQAHKYIENEVPNPYYMGEGYEWYFKDN